MRKFGFVEFPFRAFRMAMRKIEDYLKGEMKGGCNGE